MAGWNENFREGEKSGFDAGTFHIESAAFGFNDYGRCQLVLTGTFITVEGTEQEDYDLRYGLGEHFEAIDDGERAAHKEDPDKAPHEKSGFMGLVKAVLPLFDIESRGEPLDASIWVGLSFEGTREIAGYLDDEKKEPYKWFLPKKVWVTDDSAPSEAKAATNGNSDDDRKKVEVIKKSVEKDGGDYTDFLTKAGEQGFEIDDPVLEEVWG